MFIEFLIVTAIAIFVIIYRHDPGEGPYKYLVTKVSTVYDKYAPYSFKVVKQKTKSMGQEYNMRQYTSQVLIFAAVSGTISYLYFHSIIWSVFYMVISIMFIPYLAYLRTYRIYSEYIFEQIQIYTTNVIMEFNTTQSFIKSLEGVRDSGILEDPVLSDLREMIDMSYRNGTIDESVAFFNQKYPFYMVKNMNQLFLQITKEGARDSGQSLENMSMDIDALVEGVYRDQMDRRAFHAKFVRFGLVLFFLVVVLQYMLGIENYLELIEAFYVKIILHGVIIINSYFLLSGEKYYNEDVGAE